MSTITSMTTTSTLKRWAAPALAAGAMVNIAAEAIVSAAWNVRPYSYIDDYVNFLGSPFAGDFRGTTISSPLWFLMTAAWIVTGVLVAAAGIALSRELTKGRRRLVAAFSILQAVGLVLFAVFPLGPVTMASGALGLYLLGAFLSIIAGNALALTVGLSWRQLHLPRWTGISSIVLGAIGLISIPVTYGWMAIGLAERISVYSFLGWALLTGTTLASIRLSERRSMTARRADQVQPA